AKGVYAAFGFEPPHPNGDLKTSRWGSTRIRIEVTGREAHAALDPDSGVSAIDELVDLSASAIADEGVTEVLPEGGKYRFVIVGFATRGPSTFDFTTWLANDSTPDNPAGGPGIAVTGDGAKLYVAAFGSSRIGIYDTAALESDSFVPSATNQIAVTGGGPTGLVLDEA
ncbi:MAG: peptidase dimerization domain-containing protein, partial [Gemmatimonadaceae bacterium]